MAVDLAKLVVTLEAQTAQYLNAMEAAQRKLEKFAKSNVTSATAIGTALANVGTAAARGFFNMAKGAIDNADKLNKMSQSIGISVEALSELQYAADLSGLNIDELGIALTKLNKNAVEAAQGSKAQVEAFKTLGVSVTDAEGRIKSTEELLSDVADAFKKLPDGPQKTALAIDVFSKAGSKMIPVLNQGRAGIELLRKEAREFGLTISGQAGGASEAFNDNLTRINRVVQGLVTRFTNEALPTLDLIAEKFINAAREGEALDFAVKAIVVVFKTLVSAGIIITSVFQQVGLSINATGTALFYLAQGKFSEAMSVINDRSVQMKDNVKKDLESILALWTTTTEKMAKPPRPDNGDDDTPKVVNKESENAVKAIQKMVDAGKQQLFLIDASAESVMEYRIAFGDLSDEFAKAGPAAEPFKRVLIDNAKLLDDVAKRQKAAADEEQRMKELRDEGRQITESVMTANETFIAQADRLHALREQGIISEETEVRMLQRLTEERDADNKMLQDARDIYLSTLTPVEQYNAAMQELQGMLEAGAISQETFNRAAKNAKDAMDEANRGTREGASELQGFITQALSGGFEDGAKGILRGFLAMLLQMKMAALAAKLTDSLFGAAAGGNSTAGLVVAALGGGTRSTGGDVRGGHSYMVGERGPERFVPDVSGTIVANKDMAPNVTVNPSIINVRDPNEIPTALQSSAGEQAVLNILGRNQSAVRTLLQG